jgi:hypothetical protein
MRSSTASLPGRATTSPIIKTFIFPEFYFPSTTVRQNESDK